MIDFLQRLLDSDAASLLRRRLELAAAKVLRLLRSK
jgi:hypothetical protein